MNEKIECDHFMFFDCHYERFVRKSEMSNWFFKYGPEPEICDDDDDIEVFNFCHECGERLNK